MARNIAVANDVYEKLTALKRSGESFSDVIRRLMAASSGLADLAGRQTFSEEEWDRVEEVFSSQKELDQRRKEKLLDEVKE